MKISFLVNVISVLVLALFVSYTEGQSDHWDGKSDQRDGQSDHRDGQSDHWYGQSVHWDGQSDHWDRQSDHRNGQSDHRKGQSDHRNGQSDQRDGQSDQKDGESDILQQLQERIKALEKENLIILPALKILTEEFQNQKEKLTEQESIIKNISSGLDAQAFLLLQKDKTITSLQDNIGNLQSTLRTKEANEEKLTTEVRELKSEIKIQEKVMKALTVKKVDKNKELADVVLNIKEELHTKMEPELLASNTEVDSKINHFQDKHSTPHLGHWSSSRYKNGIKQYRRSTISGQNIPTNKMLIKEDKENFFQRNVDDGPVAFHARIDRDSHSHLGVNQIVKFDNELLDLGDGYHSTTGIFNAPIKGIYLFSVSLGTWCNDNANFNAVIVKNGNWIAAITGHGGENVGQLNQGSVTVAMQLDTGDQVWVKNAHTSDAAIAGWGYSTFTGILIKAM